jgi:hypothetical protein
MNSSENFGSSWSARTIVALSSRIISDTVIAAPSQGDVAGRSGSPHQGNPPSHGGRDHGFLALLGNHGDLALAVHDVKTASAESPWRKIILFFRYFALVLPPSAWEWKDSRTKGCFLLTFTDKVPRLISAASESDRSSGINHFLLPNRHRMPRLPLPPGRNGDGSGDRAKRGASVGVSVGTRGDAGGVRVNACSP